MTQTNDAKQRSGALRSDQNSLITSEGFSFSGYERDPLYLNLGTKKFLDISGVSGIDSITDGRAGVFGDFDNDGDHDVFMTTMQSHANMLFRNNTGADNRWLRVMLEGGKAIGRDAFGAVVRVKTSAGTLTKVHNGGAGFISQHDPRLIFGLGQDEQADSIEVTWPNGTTERFETNATAGSTLRLRYGSGRGEPVELASAQLPDPLNKADIFARGLRLAIGQPAPEFVLKTASGAEVTLRQLLKPGRSLLVNVWATWCLPCYKEMPELEKLRMALAAQGVDLVGINVDAQLEMGKYRKFIRDTGVRYPSYIGGVAALEQLYATEEATVPMSFILDDQGVVRELIPGWSAESRRQFEKLAKTETNIAPGK